MNSKHLFAAALLAGTVAVVNASNAATHTRDPAARGLDLFLHLPSTIAPGSTLPLQAQALGFPAVTQLAPLPGAVIEAAWNPESLGPGLTTAPKPVSATCDDGGRVHLDIPVPDGDERDLELLVSLRSGDHERTRTVNVRRTRPHELHLHVADTHVVPGSSISAWVVVRNRASGEPAANTPVELSLLEGGQARQITRLTTDAAGSAMGRVQIPRSDDPDWEWSLRARIPAAGNHDSGNATVDLTPREETPGTPRILGSFEQGSLRAGEKTGFAVTLRDASDLPVVALPVRYWIGPRGTRPPEEPKEWTAASTAAVTDAAGQIRGTVTAPTTVPPKVGTSMSLVARCMVDGHPLQYEGSVHVGSPFAEAELLPEAGSVVPGLEQRLLFRITNDMGEPARGSFRLTGDGLDTTVSTDSQGEAEFTWKAPKDLGARRDNGPCAGGVAAAVLVRPASDVAGVSRKGPLEPCVAVDRDASAILRPESVVVRAGDPVKLRIHGGTRRPWSIVMHSEDGSQTVSSWMEDGDHAGAVRLPDSAIGVWSVTATSPGTKGPSGSVGGHVMVLPKLLPKLQARLVGGRAAPGGTIEVEAALDDGHGRGLPGTVAAVVVDREGGGSVRGLFDLDTRLDLCTTIGVPYDRCDAFLEDPSQESIRRAALGHRSHTPVSPLADPAATAQRQLHNAFARVVRSLEGAVYESTESADRLRDARRKGPRGWTFNPELWTLVTASMTDPPTTPGGETLALQDLIDVDPQVSFDNVARRVTHLKLFRILVAVREWIRQRNLSPDEPALKDPNAILRRLVKDGVLPGHMLLDPWGGTIQFVRGNRQSIPFLTVRGHELHSPGPDGTLGSADDPSDPFARVLRSGSVYAEVVKEDDVVDARLDLEVSDATVSAWQRMFDSLWGDQIGDSFGAGGLGLSGVGEGGGGRGEGIGLGSIGTLGHGRGTGAISDGVAYWSPPRRTDNQGRVRFSIPLGDLETTWRVALVGIPDHARPAATHLDVTSSLPLSARIHAGASWIEGDVIDVAVMLRNRTTSPAQATVSSTPGGTAVLSIAQQARQVVTIPAAGTATTSVRLSAKSAGDASLEVRVEAAGRQGDVLRHTWEVKPAGTPYLANDAVWVEGEQEIPIASPAPGARSLGAPRLVVERGADPLVAAALDSLDPDRIATPDAIANAMDAARRIQGWGISRGGEQDPLAVRAGELGRRAAGRLLVFARQRNDTRSAAWRQAAAAFLAPRKGAALSVSSRSPEGEPSCPPKDISSLEAFLTQLELEPASVAGSVLACWESLASTTVERVRKSDDPVMIARAVLALVERPHRAAVAANLLDLLRERVELQPLGRIQLPEGRADRSSRSIVYAALLRGASIGKSGGIKPDRFLAWIAVQRDTQGGYGSTAATCAVVRALLSSHPSPSELTRVVVDSGGPPRSAEVATGASLALPLPANARLIRVSTQGPGVIARIERREMRPWARAVQQSVAPISIDVAWPESPSLGGGHKLRVTLRNEQGADALVDARVPLPPGVSLAAPVVGVHQIQGFLHIRRHLDRNPIPELIELPIRFGLTGAMTVPVATARLAHEEAPVAIAPARPLTVSATRPASPAGK